MKKEAINALLEDLWCYAVNEYPDKPLPSSIEEAITKYVDVVNSERVFLETQMKSKNGYDEILSYFTWLSFLMYEYSQEYYFPYLYQYEVHKFYQIADAYNIQLPQIPKKSDYKGRCLYYGELCKVLYKFRLENELSPSELCAFLYDYAPNSLKEDIGNLPEPSSAWFIGGKIKADELQEMTFWQGNEDTKRGDIMIHYETAPMSAITHIWTAVTDGTIDPFFHYYGNANLGDRRDIPHISLNELKEDSYFSSHPLVRKNFQGVNGWQMSSEDYSNLLRMIKAKDFDVSTLPRLYAPSISKVNVELEKDVSEKLLIPLLESMGWEIGKDFKRELPIRAGRGHRVFPDFVLHYDDKVKDEEKSKIIIEVKLHMKNNQEVSDAFVQGRSYAYQLQSSVLVLCDKESLIVYESPFDRNRYRRFYWGDMEKSEKFNELKTILNI